MRTGRPPKDLFQRFAEKLQLNWETDCWEWIGAEASTGYGVFSWDNATSIVAHRASHLIFLGAIPDGFDVHHKCRNRKCANPLHVESASRNKHIQQHTDERTHCTNGHCYATDGFKMSMVGGKKIRQCIPCRKESQKLTAERRKQERAAKRIAKPIRTECRKGHPYTPDNTAYTSNGKRTCKECWDAAKQRYKDAHRPKRRRGEPKKQCAHGHEMTAGNTYTYRGRKSCFQCIESRGHKSRNKQRLTLIWFVMMLLRGGLITPQE